MPLLRALDRASRVRLLSAPVSLACPPAGGSVQQAAPATPTPLAHDTGAAISDCNRSRNENSARTGCRRPGA